jgi:hypothetical protein
MSRPLRFVPEHALVEITTRTFQGRLLLRPCPELTDIILGIIGKAQALYSMTIHAFVFLSTHRHFLLSPTKPSRDGLRTTSNESGRCLHASLTRQTNG